MKKTLRIFRMHDLDIKLILEFKNSFGKYHPVCPKSPLMFFLSEKSNRIYT